MPEITGSWPAHARKTDDDGQTIARYYSVADLQDGLADPDRVPYALDRAQLGRIERRFPRAGGGVLRVVVRSWTQDRAARAFSGRAGGYGYDKTTAATEDSGADIGGHKLMDHGGPSGIRWDDDRAWIAVGILVVR
jgi:hypothetical protein